HQAASHGAQDSSAEKLEPAAQAGDGPHSWNHQNDNRPDDGANHCSAEETTDGVFFRSVHFEGGWHFFFRSDVADDADLVGFEASTPQLIDQVFSFLQIIADPNSGRFVG